MVLVTLVFWVEKQQLKDSLNFNGPPAPLPTEFSRFCDMKYLLEKETHNKNEENTLKELNEIFLTVSLYRGILTIVSISTIKSQPEL